MLKIHQPYIKSNKFRKTFAFASIGVFLLAIGILITSPATHLSSSASAAEIKYMQQFTNPICQSMNTGETMDLIDPRGENKEDFQTYRVIKMDDGTCWMAENLRLKANTTIKPADSDVKSDWTLPKNSSVSSTNMDWSTDNNTAYMAEGSTSMKLYSGSGGWKEAYGNYYSWN